MISVSGFSPSGSCRMVRLPLEQVGRACRRVGTDSRTGATRTPGCRAKNPNGEMPMTELDGGRAPAESDAIPGGLADGTPYLPADAWQCARALSWRCFEQYSHEPCDAVARFTCGWTPPELPRRRDLPRLHGCGQDPPGLMERHLEARPWPAGGFYGIADIARFACKHAAPHEACPHIRVRLARVQATPGFVPMPLLDAAAQARIAVSI